MAGLTDLDLLNLDEKTGKPPVPSRLTDVAAAISIYETLLRADEKSNINRSRIQAMFDGEPPYPQAKLVASGQGARCNLNFGEAARLLDTAMAGYVDLISSVKNVASVVTTAGEEAERLRNDTVISEEASKTIRDWPEFHSSFLRLSNEFIAHGVGVTYFENEYDWRFRTCGLADFLLPRQTVASEHAIEVAVSRRDYQVHELYSFISDPERAESIGWNVEAVKQAIMAANSSDNRTSFTDWENTQRELKNNDIYTGIRSNTVAVLHFWVREFDGTVSHYMAAYDRRSTSKLKTNKQDFLYRQVSRYENPEQAFILFTYGVGTNGTYHSVRGLGHRIFNHIQTSNRLRCQMVDGAMLASSVMLQPTSQRALDELALQYYGPYAVLSPNVDIVEKAAPNLTNSVVPALSDMSNQLNDSAGFYSTRSAATGSPYRSRLQVEAELEAATRLTSANLNLFYASFTRLVREMVRRITTGRKSDPAIREFFRRCAERGVDAAVIRSIDHSKTTANRAVGSGNAAARAAILNELNEVLPLLDEQGRRNLVYDRVASRVGYETVDRYATQPEQPRPSVETKVAELENNTLMTGTQVNVYPNELHETHLQIHLPLIQQLLSGIETGELDPMAVLTGLRALLEHVAGHSQFVSQDPTAAGIAAQTREVVNNAGNVVANFERRLAAQQRDQQNAGQQAQDQQSADQIQQLRAQTEAALLDIKRQKAELDLQIKQSKFEQETAIRDAKAAIELA